MSLDKICYPLSILLVTYNHERYIDRALSGLFGQDIQTPVELVIADDGSTDNTMAAIRKWEGKDPRFQFKYLDNTSNLGITKNYQRGFSACTGNYVAVLEGDDYWITPKKLRVQMEFLNAHWECDLCSVNYYVYEEELSRFTPRVPVACGTRFLGARELIADNLVGNFSTCMYRASALGCLPLELFSIRSYDWITNICISRYSLIGFLETPMSVYRLHAGGAWTQASPIEKLKIQLEMLTAYDDLTDHVFHTDFEMLGNRIRQAITGLNIDKAIEAVVSPVEKRFPSMLDNMPPIAVSIAQSLIPPRLKRYISSKLAEKYQQ